MPNAVKLRKNSPPSLYGFPPWIPVQTFAAANFLRVHEKTLLRWHRHGLGPQPIEKERYLDNQLYWLPGKLLAWWESQTMAQPRSYQEICTQWCDENKPIMAMALKTPYPEKPITRHLVRRSKSQT
jgi:hypothetical protein